MGKTERTETNRRTRAWCLRALISAAALGWLVHRARGDWILESLANMRLEFCAASLAVYCLAQCISSVRWQLLARPLGFHEPLSRLVALYYVGMFFNLFLPTSMGGDVVRAWYLPTKPGQRWLAALSVFRERFSGLLALLLLGCVASMANARLLPPLIIGGIWLAAIAGGAALVVLPLLNRLTHRFRFVAQALSFRSDEHLTWWMAFALSFLVQLASVTEVWLLGQGLGLSVTWLQYAAIVPVVTLLTMLPVSMNGIGVREGSLIIFLAPLGVGEASALTLGLVWFGVLAVASLMGGVVYLLSDLSTPTRSVSEGDYDGPIDRDSDQGRTGQSAAAA